VGDVEDQSWYRELDLDTPSPARVYDYFLGGSHNFAVDREMAAKLSAIKPDLGATMRANRAFLRRVVRFMVDEGIRQFLDLGSGVPTVGNVHEIAQKHAPDARVAYVDVDPVAVAHSSSLLAENPQAGVIRADLRDAGRVLSDPTVRGLIDFEKPVAVLLVGVLHHLPGTRPLEAVRQYRDAVVPGSFLAITVATHEGRLEDENRDFKAAYDRGYGRGADTMTFRSVPEVLAFFDGFELVEPGLAYTTEWRPETNYLAEPIRTYAAVGRRL
jgi:SAM-dependent methyltransferase